MCTMTLQEGKCRKMDSLAGSLEFNPWICYLSAHVVPKKIFPLGLVKQVKIIGVNYGSEARLLGIAVNTAFEMMEDRKNIPSQMKT